MTHGCNHPNLIYIDKIHTFFKTDFKSDYVFSGERHDYWEMVFVIKGNVGITAESSIYKLGHAQAIIHRPNEFHKIWSESPGVPTVVIVSFSSDVFPEFDGKIFSLDTNQLEEIQRLFELSFHCFERNNINVIPPDCDTSICMQEFWLRLELLVFSIVTKSTERTHTTHVKGLKSAELYSAVVRLMEENPGAGYCIEDIASEFSISSAYLKKIFIKYSGCGVMQYYNRLKARIACEYLTSGKSVKETADFLGFGDQNYFSTFFKRIIGKSPSEFKKQE